MKYKILIVIFVIMLVLTSCSSSPAKATTDNNTGILTTQNTEVVTEQTSANSTNEVKHPDGWSEETHSDSAKPNYEVVFPQDKVKRIDITIKTEDWQAMLDNMTELYGEAGTRSDRGGDERIPRGDEAQRPEGEMQPGDGNAPEDRRRPEGGMPPEDNTLPEDGIQPENGNPPEGGMPPGQGIPDDDNQAMGNRPGIGRGGPGGGMMDSSVNPIYIPVTVEFEENTWLHTGMRFKGNSSLMSTWGSNNMKLPFRLDFDEFEEDYPEIEGQRFYGFKQLAFSSNFSDDSFLREKVTADIFREAGVPAAQTAFYEVYIDYGEGPIYFGLYTLTEIVDDTVVKMQFEDGSGNVYKPEGTGASFEKGTFNENTFDKQSNKKEEDWSDIQALFDALHADTRVSDPTTWRRGLEAVFDVDGFLNWLAVNTVVQNWDTYGSMAHNYYLYHDPTSDQIIWIPWDNNMALTADEGRKTVASFNQKEAGENWPLIRYLLNDETYYEKYITYIDAVINSAFEPDKMEITYRELAALVEPYVLSENEGYTYLESKEDFHAAIEALIEHVYARHDAATKFLADQP